MLRLELPNNPNMKKGMNQMPFRWARAIRLFAIKRHLRKKNIAVSMGRSMYYNHVVFLRKQKYQTGIAFGGPTGDDGNFSVKDSRYYVISEKSQDDYCAADPEEAVKKAIELSGGPRESAEKR